MVLRHASEKFRLAYELPLENYELFGSYNQFSNVTLNNLDENSYNSDWLAQHDLWRKRNGRELTDELIDYRSISEDFYDNDIDDNEEPNYDDDNSNDESNSHSSSLIYQWHRDRHFDLENRITKYIDDKMSVID
jgi:hypothetical protein